MSKNMSLFFFYQNYAIMIFRPHPQTRICMIRMKYIMVALECYIIYDAGRTHILISTSRLASDSLTTITLIFCLLYTISKDQ